MFDIPLEWGLWGLFISSMASSTLFPGGSEAVLLLLAAKTQTTPTTLLTIATIGNTLGGMISWGMGWWLARRFHRQESPNNKQQWATQKLQRWGSPALLFSWLPIVGDPLCIAAGWLRIHWFKALIFIAIGKGARYAVLLSMI